MDGQKGEWTDRKKVKEMPGAVERVLVLYQGTNLEPREIMQIIEVVQRDSGIDLTGTRITPIGFPAEPDKDLAMAVIAGMESEGRIPPRSLERTPIHSLRANGLHRIVALVPAVERAGSGPVQVDQPVRGGGSGWRRERNHWARELIPKHLKKLQEAGHALSERPGWAALSSEPAIAFVANAKDGAMQRFGDVQIMVSLFRVTNPKRIQKRMPGGYTTWAGDVATAAGVVFGEGRADVAHWILCADHHTNVVHLAYFPATGSTALFPWDLIPPEEQQKTPRLA